LTARKIGTSPGTSPGDSRASTSAIGAGELPFGMPVAIEAVVALA
jgi:hypothetical protein